MIYEGIIFLKQLSEAEGRATPEIDAMLSDDPRSHEHIYCGVKSKGDFRPRADSFDPDWTPPRSESRVFGTVSGACR